MFASPRLRWLILTYAFTNIVLYSMLLPLWEGFDEPFHFGYVQNLSNGDGFLDPRASRLSKEIGQSLYLTPASQAVKQNLPMVTSYQEFFAWPDGKRQDAHQAVTGIDPNLRWQPSEFINYEGLQAPLAYAVLALPERIGARLPLTMRVIMLRIIAGTLGSALLLSASIRLASQLQIPTLYGEMLIFCVFSSQMTWASLARVSNDWLAIPLSIWLLVQTIDYVDRPTLGRALLMSSMLALGLLTKAYFIAFIPLLTVFPLRRKWLHLLISLVLPLVLAGPWYARNLERYNTISGMQELRDGVNPASAFHDLKLKKVPSGIESAAREALWTGNNTFRAFSTITLRALLFVWIIAAGLWAASRHRLAEWVVVLYSTLFALALTYSAAVNYVASQGRIASPGAWYTQVLLVPILAIGFLGAARSGKGGRVVALSLISGFGYILIATYWMKLIPLYSGFAGRASLAAILSLYSERFPNLIDGLNELCLGRAKFILLMAGLVTVIAFAIQAYFVVLLFSKANAAERSKCEGLPG